MFTNKNRWACIALCLIASISLMSSSGHNNMATNKKRYHLAEGSRLYLKGSSNVNTFTCDCEDQYAEQVIEIEPDGGHARFHHVELLLRSKNFNCHNRKIDTDMQKALQSAQYPHIKVALVDTWHDAKCLHGGCPDWFDVQAKVNITITKVTKEVSIPAQAKLLGPNQFRLRGEQALQMSAFGITPPEAMFGMIKVNDWIVFHFDLIVQVDEVK